VAGHGLRRDGVDLKQDGHGQRLVEPHRISYPVRFLFRGPWSLRQAFQGDWAAHPRKMVMRPYYRADREFSLVARDAKFRETNLRLTIRSAFTR
jgi:hypothetical protein